MFYMKKVVWGLAPMPSPGHHPGPPRELAAPLRPPAAIVFGFASESSKFKSFSSLTPSYLLKVTKFLVNIFQFEFLIMTEKYFCS